MAKKKIMSLDDLYTYYFEKNKNITFSSNDNDACFHVVADGVLKFEKQDDDQFLPVHLQACHTGRNLNNYAIADDVMTKAIPSFTNKPIFGYIWADDDGVKHFHHHDMHEEDGEVVRDEWIVGVIPETNNAQLKFDEDKQHNYLEVDGLIYRSIPDAADILEREGECSCSVELEINELAYDAKEKVLTIKDFSFIGVTILGMWENGTPVEPGMEGANIGVASAENNNDIAASSAEFVKQIDSTINTTKGEEGSRMDKFNELLTKYGKTVEDVTFEYEGLSDEELEAKFAEAFESSDEPDNTTEPSDPEPTPSETFSVTFTKGDKSATFEHSLNDKFTAIRDLVYATYPDDDAHWYWVEDVFEGATDAENYVIFSEDRTGVTYKQNYTFDGTDFALTGEAVEVYAMYVTSEEKTTLETMRNVYPSMNEKLQHYEDEPAKMKLLESEDYNGIRDNAEFVELNKVDAHFEMSIADVEAKANDILLKNAKAGTLNFNKHTDTTPEVGRKPIIGNNRKSANGRYGNMFNK